MKINRSIMFVWMAVAATGAVAQVYKWVDKQGKTQYTDTPPPPDAAATPAKAMKMDAGPRPPPPPASAAKNAPLKAPGSLKDLQDRAKALEKRRLDNASKETRDAENASEAKRVSALCDEANASLRELEGDKPLAKANDKGERVFMTEAERAAEASQVRALMSGKCDR